MEENVTPDPVLYVQSALLYTNSDGERRIRVHTWAAMTTPNFNDIVGSIDVQAQMWSRVKNLSSWKKGSWSLQSYDTYALHYITLTLFDGRWCQWLP